MLISSLKYVPTDDPAEDEFLNSEGNFTRPSGVAAAAGRINANGTTAAAFGLDSSSGTGPYTLNFASLGLTVPPAVLANPLATGAFGEVGASVSSITTTSCVVSITDAFAGSLNSPFTFAIIPLE